MKKSAFLIALFLIVGLPAFSQNAIPYQSPSVPVDFNLLQQIMTAKDRQYENNRNYIGKLTDWIYDLKNQTSDELFNKVMDADLETLKSFEKEDLGALYNNIRAVELNIKKTIIAYNRRMSGSGTQPGGNN